MDRISEFHRQFEQLRAEHCPHDEHSWWKSAPQSRYFMTQFLPYLTLIHSNKLVLDVLDVGTATGAGASLLAELFNPRAGFFPGMRVSALDVHPWASAYARLCFPLIEYITADVFDLDGSRKWDVVICSHVIEHVPDPVAFVEQCKRLSTGYVFLACPWLEGPIRVPGHIHTIDQKFIKASHPFFWKVLPPSPVWGGQSLIAVYEI